MQLPKVSTDIQIRYSDIDEYGHVSNSVYSQYFDIGRIHFFTELKKITEVPNMVIVSIKMDMLKEIRFNDEVVIKTRCSKMGNKSMTFEQNIYSNNELAAKGVVISTGFDPQTRKAIQLPEHWEISSV